MNKLAIPTLLVATIMVAGAFAFMPVEQASTVHTTAAAYDVKIAESVADTDTETGETFTLTCTADYQLVGLTVDMGAGTYAGGATDSFGVTIGGDDIVNVAAAFMVLGANTLIDNAEAGIAAETVIITATSDNTGDEDIQKARASYVSTGTCSWTGFE